VGDNKWKALIRERDGNRCKICGSSEHLTIHHKIPKCRGGQSSEENCVTWDCICHRAYHLKWGLTISDDFGNPLEKGYQHRNSSQKTKKPH